MMARLQPEFRERGKRHVCRRIEARSAGASGQIRSDKTSDRHPDFKGEVSVNINGTLVPLDVAMWRKTSDRAGEFFSLNIKLKQSRPSGRDNFNQRVQEVGIDIDADDEEIKF